LQFLAGKDIFQVLIDGWNGNIKQSTHQFLGQPDGFSLIAHFNSISATLCGENQKLRRTVADLQLFVFFDHGVPSSNRGVTRTLPVSISCIRAVMSRSGLFR
jgi:hypothetical protein